MARLNASRTIEYLFKLIVTSSSISTSTKTNDSFVLGGPYTKRTLELFFAF